MDRHGFQIVEWDLVLTDVDTPNQLICSKYKVKGRNILPLRVQIQAKNWIFTKQTKQTC